MIRWRRPRRVAADRERHVDALRRQPLVELGTGELGVARVDRRLEPLAHGVQRHAGLAVAHLAQRLLERALAPEVLDADGLDLGGRARGGGCSEPFALECLGVHEASERTNAPARLDSARVALYDAIATIYDPWSASVVEDIGFYVDEALRLRRPRGRARRRLRAASRCRSRRPGGR